MKLFHVITFPFIFSGSWEGTSPFHTTYHSNSGVSRTTSTYFLRWL